MLILKKDPFQGAKVENDKKEGLEDRNFEITNFLRVFFQRN